jgi:hypothetical protein
MSDDTAQALQGIGAFICEFSNLEKELGEALKVVLGLQKNPAADAIVDLIGDFSRKTKIVRAAVKIATKADGSHTTLDWKNKADKTMRKVLGCNNPGRVELAHCHIEPHADGSISLQRPGQDAVKWNAGEIAKKIDKLRRVTSELASVRTDLMHLAVPTGWMSADNFQPRQISERLWDALLSTSTSGPNTPLAARTKPKTGKGS